MLEVIIKNSSDSMMFSETTNTKGIGLANARKRLNMIYLQKHSLCDFDTTFLNITNKVTVVKFAFDENWFNPVINLSAEFPKQGIN